MISYSAIIRQAYRLTLRSRLLWLFGLFVVGGFNVNFFQFQRIPLRRYNNQLQLLPLIHFFIQHPLVLAGVSGAVLVCAALGLAVTNWSRIMLVLAARELVQKDRFYAGELVKASGRFLLPMIRLSLMTTMVMVLAAGTLVMPPLLLGFGPQAQPALWAAGCTVFLPIAFTISCLNIFAAFFMVLFRQPLRSAVVLATDFFSTHWITLLGFFLVLLVIYTAVFFAGVALVYAIKIFFVTAEALLSLLGNFDISGIIRLSPLFSNLALWVLLAGLNVFFNNALLLLFLQLVHPVETQDGFAVTAVHAVAAK